MLKIYSKLDELCFGELMLVYEEGNKENAQDRYPRMDRNAALLKAEQDFYNYLHDVFFPTKNAFYAVWEEKGKYVSALRMEPFQDGMLLEALETRPEFRRQGFAKKLLAEVMSKIEGKIYSHVNKHNDASLAVHYACGFQKISNVAVYIDGSSALWCFTLCREGKIE